MRYLFIRETIADKFDGEGERKTHGYLNESAT